MTNANIALEETKNYSRTMVFPGSKGRREKKKQKTREALEQAAWQLFNKKGYDETTVEDIAEVADVSTRTFFRYFDSKEAVLFGDWKSKLELARNLILARPKDEHPFLTLRELALIVSVEWESDPLLMARKKLVSCSEKVGEYEFRVISKAIQRSVAEALAEKLGVNIDEDIRPTLYSSVAGAALYSAKMLWLQNEGKESLSSLVQQAFDLVVNIDPREKSR